GLVVFGDGPVAEAGVPPRSWVEVFRAAGLFRDKMEGQTDRGQATFVGQFLSARSGRPVEIEVKQRAATATLRKSEGRSRQARYYCAIAGGEVLPTAEPAPELQVSAEADPVAGQASAPAAAAPSGDGAKNDLVWC